ncbi:MAG: MarR family transcriptional regulator [Angelakisella sp.]
MEPAKHFLALYHRMRLTVYRRLLHRTGRLSAADAIAADVIYLLERPTLTQFAGEMGISQPSATYRVNELAQKGVIEKIPSPRDKRECRLQVGDDYRRKTLEAPGRDRAAAGPALQPLYPAAIGYHRRRAGCLPLGTGT